MRLTTHVTVVGAYVGTNNHITLRLEDGSELLVRGVEEDQVRTATAKLGEKVPLWIEFGDTDKEPADG